MLTLDTGLKGFVEPMNRTGSDDLINPMSRLAHSDNSSEYVWPFWGIGARRVKYERF